MFFMFLLMMLLLILLISDSSFFLIPPPWHTTWSQEMTGGSAWHNCGSCCKEKLKKLFKKTMCLILTVCCLTLPPFRRPSGLLFIFFLFFQDGLALITFTIEQPGSPHSRPGFPPSLCYICQAHGLSFAWTFSSSSMWPRTSTNRAGNRPQSSSSCTP